MLTTSYGRWRRAAVTLSDAVASTASARVPQPVPEDTPCSNFFQFPAVHTTNKQGSKC